LNQVQATVLSEPANSVLVISNFTNTEITFELMPILNEASKRTKKHVRKTATLGVTALSARWEIYSHELPVNSSCTSQMKRKQKHGLPGRFNIRKGPNSANWRCFLYSILFHLRFKSCEREISMSCRKKTGNI